MALRLTPDLLAGAYEYLRASEPFCRWKLPHAEESDEVGFYVTGHRDRFGHMHGDKRSPNAIIAVSESCVGSSIKLIEIMGHEMIHLYQHRQRTETAGTMHNAEFKRLAREVCRIHMFDFKAFV